MLRSVRILASIVSLSTLVACGGGGGGAASPPPPPQGAFTLSTSSVTFNSLQADTAPAESDVTITLTGTGTAVVGAAYVSPQTQPTWLGINITGSGTTYKLALTILTTQLNPGQYTSTFQVGTANSSGSILASQPVTVTFTVVGRLAVQSPAYTGTFTYGSSQAADTASITVAAGGHSWAAASDSSWLTVPTTTQTGDGTVQATISTAGLAPGQYVGHIKVQDTAYPADAAALTFTVTVVAPVFTASATSVALGGSDGLSNAPQTFTVSLNTGTATYPYTVVVSTTSGGSWLHASSASGSVGANPVSLTFSGDRSQLVGGTYSGQINVTATVGALTLTQTLPVTYNAEANRLSVAAAGVGFLSMPGRSVLTRTVRVYNTLGRTDVPWTASSDSSWLTATTSGVTGGDITLTANPAGLPLDTTQFATVTVKSSDTTVENQQTIRVGLNLRSTAAAALSVSASGRFIAASPVEPIVFVVDANGKVVGYDVRDGTVKRTFTSVVNPGKLVVGPDGTRLYVYDQTNLQVDELDAVTGTVLHTYGSPSSGAIGGGLIVARPAGYTLLVTPSGLTYDLAAGTPYPAPGVAAASGSYSFDVSADQSKLISFDGSVYGILRTALAGGPFASTFIVNTGTTQGAAGQACIGADGDTVYTASGAPYDFPGYSLKSRLVVQTLPGTNYPNSMQCVWNGLVIGGVDGYYAPADVWVYFGSTGAQLAQLSSATETNYRSLVDRGLAVAGDGTWLISLSLSTPGANLASEIRFQPLPPPP